MGSVPISFEKPVMSKRPPGAVSSPAVKVGAFELDKL
jgi:hypothetical protein